MFLKVLIARIPGIAERIFFKFGVWPGYTSIVNLVPLGSDITELQSENCDFVVSVNILTPVVCAPFSWAAQHTVVCLDIHFGTSLANVLYIEYT